MQGRVAVAGSDEIHAALTEAQSAFAAFAASVWYYRSMRDQKENVYADGGPHEKMDQARGRAVAAIDNGERLMRDELAML